MSNQTIAEQYTVGRCRVEIHYDQDHEYDPGDRFGTITHWHRRYDFGKKINNPIEFLKSLAADTVSGNYPASLLEKNWEKILKKHYIVLPVSLLDHSGLHIWVGSGSHWSDSAGWDSGQVGFIYASIEKARENWCLYKSHPKCGWDFKIPYKKYTKAKIDSIGRVITPVSLTDTVVTLREATEHLLGLEIEDFDNALTGSVYGYVVKSEDGEEDSCWGFVGDIDYVKQEAYEHAEYENKRMAHVELERQLAEVYP